MLYSSRYTQPNRASFGQISHLVTEELTSICSESKHIAVVGPARSGKSMIANIISSRINYEHIQSDQYLESHSNKERPYAVLQRALNTPQCVISGMSVPRMLRAGLRDHYYVPDAVIIVECNEQTLEQSHRKDLAIDVFKSNLSFHKGNMTVLNEWNDTLSKDMLIDYPIIVKIYTSVY
tara:strand:- start:1865 stop:2401 length:537 start_codon:yes stop_codon:yes gene_type:complete